MSITTILSILTQEATYTEYGGTKQDLIQLFKEIDSLAVSRWLGGLALI